MKGYKRRHLGGGTALKAITRTRRSAASRELGRAPGRQPGPAVYKADERRRREAAEDAA